MLITGDKRTSILATCMLAAAQVPLDENEAVGIVGRQIQAFCAAWPEPREIAALGELDRSLLGRGSVLPA
jgi:hypothetical protein